MSSQVIFNIISIISIGYLFLYSIFMLLGLFIGIFTLYSNRENKKFKNVIKRDYYLPISIITPAFNESLIIIKSIESLLKLDYKNFELIIVDDGSTDNTSQLVIDKYNLIKVDKMIIGTLDSQPVKAYYEGSSNGIDIVLVIKENGKKGDSSNAGINVAKYGYVMIMDIDTILPKNSLEELMIPIMLSSKTIAVGSNVRLLNNYSVIDGELIENTKAPNFLTGIQELMYARSFLSTKFLFNAINCNTNISGAQGLFKKSILMDIGGYNTSTIAEDMDIIIRLHKYCLENNIEYEIKYTEDVRSLSTMGCLCWSFCSTSSLVE